MTEAIILAGGLGTRLQQTVPHLPKCMAPINGKPFLSFVIHHLQNQGIEKFIFSLGYKHEYITQFNHENLAKNSFEIVIANEPLGTGGAIQFACTKASTDNVLITNGDTLYKINYRAFHEFHLQTHATCRTCLKPMQNFSRYGAVTINQQNEIIAFHEKIFTPQGYINGWVYILHLPKFLQLRFPEKFSFEKEFLEKQTNNHELFGFVQDAYFIDIGIPEDYAKAQIEL
jgi:D-glycero-alpha-D-manno-heptose 1-phosphate guanylyltransferase